MNYNKLASFLKNLSGYELVALAGILSVSIANNLSCNEVNILASFFCALGDNLAAVSSANENSF